MELGQLLKQARLEAGLTQRQLCGGKITRNMLSQIENGSAKPSMDTLRYLAERLVLTQINLKKLTAKDFERQENGAVLLTKDGRKTVLTAWQEKKRSMIEHPVLNEKIPLGLLPYVQSHLLAKYIRGETEEYPNWLAR